ncbi:hypothetical protein [Streptococcus gallolyticus]|uniref:hypothetical protein n=1 Tax=Streptococcus gallolyticus TaxID=315405 RepID=UPI00211C1EDB|nr:hypothetical protein [Streptococcus gallolyticus]MCQ9216168.1 hypothetical protein [Streptococcus gallolyticus]
MKKKVLSLIVTGFVATILTGCGASQAATSSSTSDSNTVIKVGQILHRTLKFSKKQNQFWRKKVLL